MVTAWQLLRHLLKERQKMLSNGERALLQKPIHSRHVTLFAGVWFEYKASPTGSWVRTLGPHLVVLFEEGHRAFKR